jgi:phosphonate transport system ATP-binding protein
MQTPAGQMVGMIERSRAGKSTLLRLINCLIDPTRSTIYWREVNITAIKGGAAPSLAWALRHGFPAVQSCPMT